MITSAHQLAEQKDLSGNVSGQAGVKRLKEIKGPTLADLKVVSGQADDMSDHVSSTKCVELMTERSFT